MVTSEGCLVLVVDDEPTVLAALSELLGEAGYAVDTAATATDAVRQICSRHPEVVVADPELPGLHAFELVRRIRTAAANVPLVLMTRRENDRPRPGVDRLVAKPVDVGALIGAIEAVRAEPRH